VRNQIAEIPKRRALMTTRFPSSNLSLESSIRWLNSINSVVQERLVTFKSSRDRWQRRYYAGQQINKSKTFRVSNAFVCCACTHKCNII
jgi:hypothetical protein